MNDGEKEGDMPASVRYKDRHSQSGSIHAIVQMQKTSKCACVGLR